MTTKKLYEMTPEEQKALSKEEFEQKVLEMALEGAGERSKYIYITAHEKEKSLPESLKPFKFSRFFFCDAHEGIKTMERLRAAAFGGQETIREIYYEAVNIILEYSTYYADICNRDAEQIAQDLIAFVKTLEFVQFEAPDSKGKDVYLAYPGNEQDSIEGSFYGWALIWDKTPPESLFDKAYSLITNAVEIGLLALSAARAPHEVFTAVYSAFVEKITQTIPAPENVKDYTEHNARFDDMFEPEPEQEQEQGQNLRFEGVTLPNIAARHAKKFDLPIDKINSKVWNGLQREIEGQIFFEGEWSFNMAKRGSNMPALVSYSISFPKNTTDANITISKKIEPYDELVEIAAGALYNATGDIFTIHQLYHAMGYNGTPGTADIERINNSLKKMRAAQITISNTDEAAKQKRRKSFVYEGAMLPSETISAVISGKRVDEAIHLLREPPLIAFARSRKQISTYPRDILSAPINKTNENIAIMRYILERIAQIKHGDGKPKILYKTLYTACNITEKKQKSRAKDKIEKFMNHCKNQKIVKNFQMLADGFTIEFDGIIKR